MRNVYLYIGLFILFGIHCFGQGTDVIIVIDNSGSITRGTPTSEYEQMRASIVAISQNILACNPLNRVAVVQYGAPTTTTRRIYIESGFSSTVTLFAPRFNQNGNVPGAIDLISNAVNLFPVNPAEVTSPITTLPRTSGNALAVYLFTDAVRNNDLLTGAPAVGSNSGFASFTNFKNSHGATFVVTNTTAAANAASAGIASVGGAYTGIIESYSADPDGAGVLPRLFLSSSFALTATEIETITDYLCSVTPPSCVPNLVLTSADNVPSGQDNRQALISISASNVISGGAVGVYHAEETIVLLPGFHSQNASRFRAYIANCDSGYVGRPSEEERASSDAAKSSKSGIFAMYPNPATDRLTLSSDAALTSVTITSLDGMLMYSTKLSGKETAHDVDVSRYRKGLYIVNITTADGKTESQKLMKD
ncbi:MAG: 3-coathanger stack domain-containing protein [Flavobacterium sp.]